MVGFATLHKSDAAGEMGNGRYNGTGELGGTGKIRAPRGELGAATCLGQGIRRDCGISG